MKADLVLMGGKVITMNNNSSIEEAVAVKHKRIIRVSSNAEINSLIGKFTKIIELDKRIALPGFIDSHSHMISMGARRILYVDLSEEAGVKRIADIVERLKERANNTPRGEWVIGYQEDDSKLVEKRHPTRWEIDKASTEHPIIFSTVGGHFSIANSLAFEMAGISKDTPNPIGGKIDRDENNVPTGGLHEKAIDLILPDGVLEPTRKQSYDGAKQILMECAENGITCVYDTVQRSEIRAVLDLKNNGKLPIRVRMDVKMDLFPELDRLGIYRGLGGEWLRICGLKYFFDGAISARTAAVTEEYLNQPGFFGVMATTREIATKTLTNAYSKGYRLSCHANGDRAINMYLDIMEELQTKYPRNDPRNRDIHCTVITPKIVERIKNLNILPTIFGPYPYYHGDKLLPAFGEKRLERMFAARTFIDTGVVISAHSDHPCAPYPPLMAIHSLVNRKTKTGKPIGQSQKISVMEALKLYTINAAYHSFDEKLLGSIEEGKLADMVVLGEDILSVPKEKIIDIPIDFTIIDGKIVFKRD